MTFNFWTLIKIFAQYNDSRKAKFQIYKDKTGKFRWRLMTPYKKNIAESTEGYEEKYECIDGLKLVKTIIPDAKIEELT